MPAAWDDELLSSTLENFIEANLADNVSSKIALYAYLKEKGRVVEDGGATIVEPLMYGLNDTVTSFDDYDTFDTSPSEGIGNATYDWKFITGSIVIALTQELKNSGKSAVFKLLEAKVEQLELSIAEVLNEMFFGNGTGNGGKDMLGLAAIVDDTGTIGGIPGATETWWRSVVDTSMNIAANINELNTLYNSVARGSDMPDLEITTQAGFEKYESLASPNIRFQDTDLADLGFQSLAHKGAAITYDAHCPSGEWYILNSRYLKLVTHSDAWMRKLEFVRPANQAARVGSVVSAGNLITNNRRMLGKADALVLA